MILIMIRLLIEVWICLVSRFGVGDVIFCDWRVIGCLKRVL